MSKFCKMCGTELPSEETMFCVKCGANQGGVSNSGNAVNSQNQNGYSQNYNASYAMQQNRKITGIGEWIGWILLCSFLPIIGQIIMLCTSDDESVKNYAKANLIFSAIAFVIIMIIVVFLVVAGISMAEMF